MNQDPIKVVLEDCQVCTILSCDYCPWDPMRYLGACAYHIYPCISQPFMTEKSAQKIILDLYTGHIQRPDPSNPRNQHNNCLKSINKTKFIKPVLIVFEFCQFSACSSSTKNFEIINFTWFLLYLLICRADTFPYCFAAVYGTELSFSSNDCSSLATWQMLFSCAVLFVMYMDQLCCCNQRLAKLVMRILFSCCQQPEKDQ